MDNLYYIVDISDGLNSVVIDNLTCSEVESWFREFGDIVIHEVKQKNIEN